MTRNARKRSALLLGVALSLSACHISIAQAGGSATQALLDKAHTLEAKGRMDMAAQTWQQVLLADPNNTEALGGLARSAKLSGNQALANTYLQRLRAISPNDPGIARAENMMAQSAQLSQLQQAGKLASQGNYAQAMVVYRQVFGSQPPAGEWSLAYYETEAATEDGRPHAVAGLRALVDKYPQDSRYQIALGRILTYNPKTRAEGRKYLERHPNSPEAVDALKKSLVWDSRNPATSSDIRAYLQKHKDPQLQDSLKATEAEARASGATRKTRGAAQNASATDAGEANIATMQQRADTAELRNAYAALNAKRLDDAETRFKAILAKEPKNARALAGIGYVRMNQQNFGGAISFLEQAKADGANDPGLDKNLETSRFFFVLSEGGIALNENDLANAEKKYRQALVMRPNSPEALQGLGGTLMKAGQPQAALPYMQQFLKLKPSAAAWRGVFTAQFQAGNASAALETEKQIPAAIRAQLLRDPDYLRTLASAYSAVGRDADAQRVLRSALDLPFPADAKGMKAETQLQYASLLLQANRVDQASALYRQVLATDPNNVLAWQGLVNAEHTMQSDQLALQTIESMPPAVYDQALRDSGFLITAAAVYQGNNKYDLAQSLLERAIAARNTSGQVVPVPLQVQLAGLYLQRNDAAHAFPIYQRILKENPDRIDAWRGLLNALHIAGRDQEALAEIQQIPPAVRRQLENNVDYLQTVGQIYNGLGQPRQALVYLNRVQQHYATQHTRPPADVDVQNAWLLYNGMNDAGLYRQLLTLGSRTDLSDDQRRTVQTIWTQWAVRRANQASAANNPRRALAILNAAAESFPDNPAVIKALAGGYVRAGLPKQAILIFKAQDMSSASASDYKAAVGAALAGNDQKDAETWLRYALDKYPKDGEILGLAAKFEQARGDSGRAADYYKAALAALPPPDPGTELAYMLHQPMPLNPRALPSAQAQGLAALLAPGTDASGQPLRDESVRPYLPSYGDGYGTPPVQVDGGSGYVVPQYMSNPSAGGSRLRDYAPAQRMYDSPAGGYQPPSSLYPGMSESDVPADANPSQDGAQYLAEQQEQVQRANQVASAAGASALQGAAADDLYAGGAREGAQTGAFNGEVFGPYVPYVAPTLEGKSAVSYQASNVEVPSTTIITEFPTGDGKAAPVRNARNTKGHATIHHKQDAAAEAAEIRRRQSDPNSGTTTGVSHPDELADLSSGQNVQYTGGMAPAPGQTSRPSSTSPGAQQTSNGTGGMNLPQSAGQPNGDSMGQQYPQPIRRVNGPATTASRRRRTSRTATAVAGFGPGSAPIFYPSVPTGLSTQPYPDLPPYSFGNEGPPTDDQLVARNVPPLRSRYSIIDLNREADGGPPLTERQRTELDLATLESSYSGWVGGSAIVRVRSGQPGIDRLQDYEVPFEASVVVGKTARFTVVPRAVFLTSGTIDNTRYTGGFVPYLGTLPANAVNTPSSQFASGVGGEIQMVTQNLGLSVGYTPYEFLVNNVTARLRYRPAGGPFTLFGERDSVRDTQLSYAGLRDPGSVSLSNSGNIWGGVVSTGGGVRFDHGNERAGFYIGGSGAVLTGYHTLDNSKVEGLGGAYFRIKQFPGYGTLNIGANLFAEHYAHNERALTYGNGGYFSPEVYFLGSVPVTFNGYYKSDWHYVITAGIGVQTFQEDTAIFYPLLVDAPLQNAAFAGCTIPQIAGHNCPTAQLPVNSNTGANFGIEAEGSYRITEHWYAGAALAANNTNNYNVVQPTVFLRYLFRPQYATEEYPTGLFPVQGFRPLRVP